MLFIFQRLGRIGIGGTDGLNADSQEGEKDDEQSGEDKNKPAYPGLVRIVIQPFANNPSGKG